MNLIPFIGKVVDEGTARERGTAWLLSPTQALTAAHCVGDRQKQQVDPGPFSLHIGGRRFTARILDYDFELDSALLTWDDIFPISFSLRLASMPGIALAALEHQKWQSYGFPLAAQSGMALTGTVTLANGNVEGHPAIQLLCDQGGLGSLQGISGAPVSVGEEIVGLIRWAPPTLGQRVIMATSIKELAARFPAVAVRLTDAFFVDRVSELYRLLGYEVTRDRSLGGSETDLLCVLRVRGAPITRLLVRCESSGEKELPPEKVQQFNYHFQIRQKEYRLTGGALVSNKPLAENCRGVFEFSPYKFFTYEELFDELLNVAASLQSFVIKYEGQEIHKYYIPLSCFQADGNVEQLMSRFNQWMIGTSRLMVILGDFGTGKSTFLDRAKYDLSLRYMQGLKTMIPVKILLRDFESMGSVDRFIEHQIQSELDVSLPFSRIVHLLRSGRFVLFLDGFDEMGQQINARIRKAHFEALVPLMAACPKTVLTCRPNYLVTDQELDQILSHLRLFEVEPELKNVPDHIRTTHSKFLTAATGLSSQGTSILGSIGQVTKASIAPLTEADIDIYVESYVKDNKEKLAIDRSAVRTRIRNTYDLEDLAKRPILLNIIVRTLPYLPAEQEASPCIIYEAYTNSWMQHDYAKGAIRMLIPPDQKRAFTQDLAWILYRQNKISIAYAEFEQLVSDFFDSEDVRKEFLASHMQFCSFLSRDSVGNFRFIHKSFMEYFAAEYLRAHFLHLREGLLSQMELSEEVCFFLGDLIHIDSRFGTRMVDLTREVLAKGGTEEPIALDVAQRNLLRVFSYSRGELNRFSVSGQWWDNLRFVKGKLCGNIKNGRWTKLRFTKFVFDGLRLNGLEIADVDIEKTVWSKGAVLDVVNMSGGISGDHLRFIDCTMSDIQFIGRLFLAGERNEFHRCTWELSSGSVKLTDSILNEAKIQQSYAVLDWKMSNVRCSFFIGGPSEPSSPKAFFGTIRSIWDARTTRGVATWTSCIFENCSFLWWDFSVMRLNDVEFRNCRFIACRFSASKKHKQYHELKGSQNCFYVSCVKIIDDAEEQEELQGKRTDRKLFDILETNLKARSQDQPSKALQPQLEEMDIIKSLSAKDEITKQHALWLLSPRSLNKLDPRLRKRSRKSKTSNDSVTG